MDTAASRPPRPPLTARITSRSMSIAARAGLVIIPRHPVEGRLGLHLGTVVHAVLHHAQCPVAVVPVR